MLAKNLMYHVTFYNFAQVKTIHQLVTMVYVLDPSGVFLRM